MRFHPVHLSFAISFVPALPSPSLPLSLSLSPLQSVADHCDKISSSYSSVPDAEIGFHLHLSSDFGASFTPACIPQPEQLPLRSYSVVHAQQGSPAIVVNVDFGQGRQVQPFGDLLVGDMRTGLFSFSLGRNARSHLLAVDFTALQVRGRGCGPRASARTGSVCTRVGSAA